MIPNSKEKVPRISRHDDRILEKTTQGAPEINPDAPESALVLPKSTLGLLKFDLGTKIMPFFVSDAFLGAEKGAKRDPEWSHNRLKIQCVFGIGFGSSFFSFRVTKWRGNGAKTVPEKLPRTS